MSKPKLNQVIAIEKGVKSRVYGEITEMHKTSQKAELFNGFAKNYRKKDEDGEDYLYESSVFYPLVIPNDLAAALHQRM